MQQGEKVYTRKKGDEDDERTKDIWKDLNVHSVDSSNISLTPNSLFDIVDTSDWHVLVPQHIICKY
jgi:hypothetical protein